MDATVTAALVAAVASVCSALIAARSASYQAKRAAQEHERAAREEERRYVDAANAKAVRALLESQSLILLTLRDDPHLNGNLERAEEKVNDASATYDDTRVKALVNLL